MLEWMRVATLRSTHIYQNEIFEVKMAIRTINCDGINLSLLAPGAYELIFARLPNVSFMCQSVNIPSVSLGRAMAPYSKHDVPLPGEKLVFGQMTAQILLDSELNTYYELYDWMKKISVLGDAADDVSQCYVITGPRRFSFEGVFPTDLTNLNFSSILTDVPPITFTATFSQIKFELNPLS